MKHWALLVCLALALMACTSAPSDRSALSLEATLLAPCCYNGTLATHESELARSLRAEIETRVASGEPTTAIRADMVARYGEQVLAMPNEHHFDAVTAIAGLVGAALTLLLVLRGRSWFAAPATAPATPKDAYDDRIDAELEDVE